MIRINLDVIIRVVIIVLSAFIAYHLILKLLGGSLEKEDFILSFIIVMISINGSSARRLGRLEGKFEQFEKSFRALAYDFKSFREEFRNHNHKGGKVVF